MFIFSTRPKCIIVKYLINLVTTFMPVTLTFELNIRSISWYGHEVNNFMVC